MPTMNLARALVRALEIWAIVTLSFTVFFIRWLALRLRGASRDRRRALLHETLLLVLGSLGATFVKIGQYLSTRPDLVPPHLAGALSRLQDAVPPFPYPQVRATLCAELGDAPEEVFSDVDPYPVASASVAQVHAATLVGGRKVAVKVLRPGIRRTVRTDLFWLRFLARAVAALPRTDTLSPVEVVEEFSAALWQQLDLLVEARNNEQFAHNFADNPDVTVPKLERSLCTSKVLCMEFVDGRGMLHGDWDRDTRVALARAGYRMLLRMVFAHGFVHADLHPGNMLVRDGGIVLLDLGLVSRLDPAKRAVLVRLFAGWLGRSPDRVTEALLGLLPARDADVSSTPNTDELGPAVMELMDRYTTVELGRVGLGEVLGQMLCLLYAHGLRVDPSLTMTIVSLGIVEGVGRQLAPYLDLMQESMAAVAEIGIPLGS